MSEELEEVTPEAVTAPSEDQTTKDQTATEAVTDDDEAAKPEGEEAEAPEDDGKDDDERPKKKSRSERLRRQNERLQAEIASLRSGTAPMGAAQDEASIEAAVKAQIGDAPKEADFADWFEYQTALTAYNVDKRQVARQVKGQVETAKAAYSERLGDLADDYQDNLKAAAKQIPDLLKVIGASTYVPTPLVETLILEAGDKAPLVAYHLAQNPKDAAKLNAMTPTQAAREIGRIEGRVSAPKPRTATSAPAPVTAPRGSAAPASQTAELNAWLKSKYG